MVLFPYLLAFHIVTGGAGLITGAAALVVAKGSRLHIRLGITFWYLMSAMAVSGIILAILRPQVVFVLIGVFSLYLVNTGRNALTRANGKVNPTTWVWFAISSACTVAALGIVLWAFVSGENISGTPVAIYMGIAFDGSIFAVLDWRLVSRGQAIGKDRVIDHLWRMIAAMIFGVFALFVANPQIWPIWFTDTGLNFLPALLLLAILVYWVVRVRRGKIFRELGQH